MIISFIGAGKAGTSLGKYFKKFGHNIKYVWDMNENNSEIFSKELNCKILSFEEIIKSSDIIFLTVNDGSINELWHKIFPKLTNESPIFLHCSGAKEGIYGKYSLYSLHPASPLTGKDNLENICFGLENFGEKKEFIKSFIESLGNKVFLIPKEKKKEYHLANVIVSNLTLSLVEKGVSYLKTSGLNESDSIELLMPLAKQNLLNIESEGILKSVTGPVSRGDIDVCRGHLEVIKDEDKNLYIELSNNILKILGKNDKDFFRI